MVDRINLIWVGSRIPNNYKNILVEARHYISVNSPTWELCLWVDSRLLAYRSIQNIYQFGRDNGIQIKDTRSYKDWFFDLCLIEKDGRYLNDEVAAIRTFGPGHFWYRGMMMRYSDMLRLDKKLLGDHDIYMDIDLLREIMVYKVFIPRIEVIHNLMEEKGIPFLFNIENDRVYSDNKVIFMPSNSFIAVPKKSPTSKASKLSDQYLGDWRARLIDKNKKFPLLGQNEIGISELHKLLCVVNMDDQTEPNIDYFFSKDSIFPNEKDEADKRVIIASWYEWMKQYIMSQYFTWPDGDQTRNATNKKRGNFDDFKQYVVPYDCSAPNYKEWLDDAVALRNSFYELLRSGRGSTFDPTYWYTEDDIQTILTNHFTSADVVISAQTQFEHADLLQSNINEALMQLIDQGNPATTIVVPVHLHGNHWSGMVIQRTGNGTIMIIYNDPIGNSIEAEQNCELLIQTISQNLNEQGVEFEFIDLKLQQQDNDCDCGPFTASNLMRLADLRLQSGMTREQIIKEAELEHSTGNAEHIRKEHAMLLHPEHAPEGSSPMPEDEFAIHAHIASASTNNSEGQQTCQSYDAAEQYCVVCLEDESSAVLY